MVTADGQPDVVGSYRIEGVLGAGGMGVVYRGVDAEGRLAAIKMIRGSFNSAEALRRFEREASIRIVHPNVVRVLETGTDINGTPFIAFELLEGETLAERLARGTMEIAEVVDLGLAVCAGLAAAHREGVIHRDLKPSNVFLEAEGRVKLLDFGVARLTHGETQLTAAGRVVGTLDYLSPEQAEGNLAIEATSDLFSLGAVLYQALVGRPPFRQGTTLGTLVATLLSDPAPPHFERPDVPAALEAVVLRALQKDPPARFVDALDFSEALAHSRGGDVSQARHPPTIPPGEQRVVAVLLARGLQEEARLARAIREEGGRVLHLLGDRLLGIFGAETTVGDELVRAASVAVRCRPYADRVAIGSGRAAGAARGIYGSALDEAESALSVVVAGVGVSAEAARGLPKDLPLEAHGDFLYQLAPDTQALMALDLLPDDGPIFGRHVEIAMVERAFDEAVSEGTAKVALISGPQGIGKSRLREEVMALVQEREGPIRVMRARAAVQRSRRALSLFQSLIRGALAATKFEDHPSSRDSPTALESFVREFVTVPSVAARIAEDLALLVRDTGDIESRFSMAATDLRRIDDRLRVSMLDWLEATCRSGPLVLVLEDLSFADPQSLELLERLIERCFDAPLFVLICARPDILEARPDLLLGAEVHRVVLRGLNRGDVARLVAHAAKAPVPEALATRIHDRTAGNPFFVQQIVAALADLEPSGQPPSELPIPLTVEAAVQSRLDHLPSSEKELVKRASVYGRPFDVDDLAALGTAEGALLLRSLRRREVVVARERGRFDFKSALTGEVAYRMLAEETCRPLHRAAAEWLEGRDGADPEEVARHYDAAGDGEVAAGWYVRAAVAATRRGDVDTVLRTTTAALRDGAPEALRFVLHMARADALRFRSRQEQAPELEAALRYARDDRDQARVLAEQSVGLSRAGRSDEAVQKGLAAVAAASRADDDRLVAVARGRLALALIQSGDLERARALISEVELSSAEAEPELRALILEWRAQVAGAAGDLGTRMRSFAAAAEVHELLGDLRRAAGARANLADMQNRFGAYADAASALVLARDACREVGHRAMEGYVLLNLGYSLAMRDETDASLEALAEAEVLAGATNEARLALLVMAYRARTLHRGGRHEEARDLGRRSVRDARAASMESVAVGAQTVLAGSLLALGEVDAAVKASTEAYEACVALGGIEEDEIEVYLTHARALFGSGRDDDAQRILAVGQGRLMALANGLLDETLRDALLDDVPAHRELTRLCGRS